MDQQSGLPTTDPELVHQMQIEHDEAFRQGTEEQLEAARFRLIWAMVHSTDNTHINRGLDMARRRLRESQVQDKDRRELQYLSAVACFRLGKYVEARRILKELLLVHPDFRQAEFLQSSVDDKILREGLLGVGIGAAVLGVAGVGLAVLFGASRSR